MRFDNLKKIEVWFFFCGKLIILFLVFGGELICDMLIIYELMEIR